jgi:hypothetical protein
MRLNKYVILLVLTLFLISSCKPSAVDVKDDSKRLEPVKTALKSTECKPTKENPHDLLDENGKVKESKCMLCHTSKPDISLIMTKEGDYRFMIEDYVDFSKKCDVCHPGNEEAHPVSVGHNGIKPSEDILKCMEESIEKMPQFEIPLHEGKIYCGTCHDPHIKSTFRKKSVTLGTEARGEKYLKQCLCGGFEMCVACHCDPKF